MEESLWMMGCSGRMQCFGRDLGERVLVRGVSRTVATFQRNVDLLKS